MKKSVKRGRSIAAGAASLKPFRKGGPKTTKHARTVKVESSTLDILVQSSTGAIGRPRLYVSSDQDGRVVDFAIEFED